MKQLELNKPHIQQKLRNSGAIEAYQAAIGRQAAEVIFGKINHIDWCFRRLQEIIDQPGDNMRDQIDLNGIYFDTVIPFMNGWEPGKGNKYLAIQNDLRTLVDEATKKLERRNSTGGDETIK